MVFELVDISELEKINSDLEIGVDPFSSEKNKKRLLRLRLLVEKSPEKYLEIDEEVKLVQSPIADTLRQLSEQKSEHSVLFEKISEQQVEAEVFKQEAVLLAQEIEDLEEEKLEFKDSEEEDDRMIASAMHFLIEGKKQKLERFSEFVPEELADYQKNIDRFYAKEAEFKENSENLSMLTEILEENLDQVESHISERSDLLAKSRELEEKAPVEEQELEEEKLVEEEEQEQREQEQQEEKLVEQEEQGSEQQALEAIIPTNAIKKSKYRKLLGK